MSDAKLQNPNRNRIVAWAEYNEAQRLPSRENSSLFFKTSAVNVGLRWRSTQPNRARTLLGIMPSGLLFSRLRWMSFLPLLDLCEIISANKLLRFKVDL